MADGALTRLARLEAQAAGVVDAERARRAAVWARVQAEAPEFARLLLAVNERFGKPARVELVIRGERVI